MNERAASLSYIKYTEENKHYNNNNNSKSYKRVSE